MPIKDMIEGINIFDGLSSTDIDQIISLCQEKTFKKDNVIVEEDDVCTNIYIILEGRAKVELKATSVHINREEYKHLATLRKGEIFGEMTFLGGGRRSARVVADDNIRLLIIDGIKLNELFEKNYRLGYIMMRNIGSILVGRLSEINFKFRDNM